jgi:hypothetical protein
MRVVRCGVVGFHVTRRWPRGGSFHRAVSASLRPEGERSAGSESCCLFVPRGLPRAHASLRRWSTFVFEVHAGTYVEVFLIFGVYWRAALTALSILLAGTGGARASHEPTDVNRCDGSAGRTGPGVSPGRLFPDRSELCPQCTSKRAARGNTYLENLPRDPHSSGESAGGAASFRGTEMVPYLE